MTRRNLDDTRRRLLDEGVRLFLADATAASVDEIRVREVAARLGMTTGAAYRCWPNQAAYRRDLGQALIEWRDKGSIDLTVEAVQKIVRDGGTWTEIVRRGADSAIHEHHRDRTFLALAALRTSFARDDELARVARNYHDGAMASYQMLYEAMLHHYGRRMRDPFTVEQLTTSLAALAEGFDVQAQKRVEHPRLEWSPTPEDETADWSLLGAASIGIIERLTEADPDRHDRAAGVPKRADPECTEVS